MATVPADDPVEATLVPSTSDLQLDPGSSSQQPIIEGSNGTHPIANGHHAKANQGTNSASVPSEEAQPMSLEALQAELERVKEERDSFEEQYHGLLGKLGQMRSTLGDRLRQDAEELDRREQQIDALTARVDELTGSTQTLEGELVTSHEEVERLTKELDAARAAQQESSTAVSDRKGAEARMRELQEMAERYRIEAESWEGACMEERANREDVDLQLSEARRALEEAQTREREQAELAQREVQTARELQQILEEFQAAQDGELQRAIGDHEAKIAQLSAALEEHQSRTQTAEAQAKEFHEAAQRCQSLEQEVKEKNLLIGKLRHEAVILNEHLTESLRRLRANQSDANVDGKLISNLLIQFLSLPRNDTKRFEILSLIGSVLNWSAEERERAGLQRNSTLSAAGDRKGSGHRRSGAATVGLGGATSPGPGNDESFSNLFVEFLLSEADKAKQPDPTLAIPGPSAASSPSATRPSFNLGRLASLTRSATEEGAKDAGTPTSGSVRSP